MNNFSKKHFEKTSIKKIENKKISFNYKSDNDAKDKNNIFSFKKDEIKSKILIKEDSFKNYSYKNDKVI